MACGRALNCPGKPVSGHRFQNIVDCIEVKRLNREILMRGHENNRWRCIHFRYGARHAQPVQFRHSHVEQDQIGGKRFGQSQRGCTIARRADNIDCRDVRTKHLNALNCQWLIIDNQSAQSD